MLKYTKITNTVDPMHNVNTRMGNVNMSDDPIKEHELQAITADDTYEDQTGSDVENVLGSVHISKPSIKHVFFLLRPILKPLLEQFNKQEHELHELVNMMKLERTAIDTPAVISQNLSYEVDYKGRQFLYVFTPQTITLNLSSGGSIVATTNNWTPLALPRGTKVTAPAISDAQPVQITIRATDRLMAVWAELVNGISSIGTVGLNPGSNLIGRVNVVDPTNTNVQLVQANQAALITPANNNASVPTGAANTVIKNAPGSITSIVVTTAGTGAGNVIIFDNASTNSGTPLAVIPATVSVGQQFQVNGWAKLGMTAQNVLNGPVFTVFFS